MSLLTTVTAANTLITSQAATIADLKTRPIITPEDQAALDALQATVDAQSVPVTPTP